SGNTARAIGKDARYTVKLNGSIELLFDLGDNEHALLTTDAHPELVELVNAAKRFTGSSQGGGGFVINEYRHVLVPASSGDQVLFAGVYTRDLEFEFDGMIVSPVAPPGITAGDAWPGPHVGIKYTLAAGASDVRYEQQTARGTIRQVLLSKQHASGELEPLL